MNKVVQPSSSKSSSNRNSHSSKPEYSEPPVEEEEEIKPQSLVCIVKKDFKSQLLVFFAYSIISIKTNVNSS